MKPYFSIIVPVKNEERLIEACLHSLKHQGTTLPYEILLVDGHSTDQTRAIAKKYPVKIISESKPGKCHGLQTAVQRARGTILCFTEADCVVQKDWLQKIYLAMTSAPLPAAVTGVYTYHHSTALYNTLVRIILPIGTYIARLLIGVYPVRTTNFAIWTSVMKQVGGFNTKTTELYDLDLSLRLHPNYIVRFDPTLFIQTSDRRIRGRVLSYLFEFATSVWYTAVLRKPVINPVYADIR